eukprot:CAMPEP_0119324040 /NCGR_PEP_ID=MMETSP1333-20130426/62216_1 /TAXON_ID=418940 /ORGANISM="Scyphosphaera apsteinii, Strain RCC1455" /LENGTH=76 /DNA_ID=CAMNT_0007331643 /DNA_START=120 /DNA_END=346 /DNA_ORIENTATION=+
MTALMDELDLCSCLLRKRRRKLPRIPGINEIVIAVVDDERWHTQRCERCLPQQLGVGVVVRNSRRKDDEETWRREG